MSVRSKRIKHHQKQSYSGGVEVTSKFTAKHDLDLDLEVFLAVPRVVGENILGVCLAVPRVVGENILGVFLAVPVVVGKNILEVFLILGATGHGCSGEGTDAAPRAHGTRALQARSLLDPPPPDPPLCFRLRRYGRTATGGRTYVRLAGV